MPIACHAKNCWSFCMSEDQKKEKKTILLNNNFNVYNLRVLKFLLLDIVQNSLWISSHFDTQRLDIVQISLWISFFYIYNSSFLLVWILGTFAPKYKFENI